MNKKFKIAKWIFLSLAILSNAFIIAYSSLDEATTIKWNYKLTHLFAKAINNVTEKEVVKVPLKGISVSFSNETNYKWNYLSGYELEQIPLGSAKQIECSFNPLDASDKAITYTASPAENVVLNQSGSTLSVIGMKPGNCVIKAKSADGGFEKEINVNVVETIAPISYEISLKNTSIPLGTSETINVDIDGGVLGHNELVNFRYYDTRKLSYTSSNEAIAKIDPLYGVITPLSVGSSTITVSNGLISKEIDINVTSGTSPLPIDNLTITGSNVCYANDMILDQNGSHKHHYQLTPKSGSLDLNPEDFIWTSSNDLLLKVDKHGVMRGFRKTSKLDETAKIRATSKITGDFCEFIVTVKNQLPTNIYFSFIANGQEVWNHAQHTFFIGDNINVKIAYSPDTQTKDVVATSSDESVVSITNEGASLTLHMLKEGNSLITMTSVINPELVAKMECIVIKPGAIDEGNVQSFGTFLRKTIGHAAVFMVAQIFTFLALYMFLYEKKWWLYSSISLGEGLFICVLSELIQHFVPTRDGTVKDVFIDFAGVVVGFALAFLTLLLIKKIIKKKKEPQNK